MQAVDAVPLEPLPPPVEHGPGDSRLSASRRHTPEDLRTVDDTEPHHAYTVVQGHRSCLLSNVPGQGVALEGESRWANGRFGEIEGIGRTIQGSRDALVSAREADRILIQSKEQSDGNDQS